VSTISDRAHRAVLALCVAAALGGCHGSSDGGSLVGTLERDRIEIIAQADEPIIAIAVREGDHVTRGELLLQQELTSATARTAEASANAAGAQHRLAELVAGPRVEELTEARAHVASAKATFERDARELQRASDLVPQHLISQTQFDDARAARDRSAAQLHDAQAQLTALERGTRIEQLDQARAALAAAQSAREQVSVTAARRRAGRDLARRRLAVCARVRSGGTAQQRASRRARACAWTVSRRSSPVACALCPRRRRSRRTTR
jgi:HlyD family secretion protein